MNSIWQMWSGDVPPNACDKIIRECEQIEPMAATVGGAGTEDGVNTEVRRSEVRWAGQIQWIKDLVFGYAATANRNAFGFDISYLSDVQYTIYKGTDEGYYNWHHDTFWGGESAYDRKISVIIQLSGPTEYEGGEFLLDEQYPAPDKKQLTQRGTVLCFPSFILHTVKPVTKGTRRSLVAWVEGPKFR